MGLPSSSSTLCAVLVGCVSISIPLTLQVGSCSRVYQALDLHAISSKMWETFPTGQQIIC